MSLQARLVLLSDASKVAPLHPSLPHTIGRAANNRLSMPTTEGVAPHHAVVRFSRSHGWLVCDWGSPEGTWLEGQRIRHCRPLSDGDHIQLGPLGPVLVFQLQPVPPAGVGPADAAAAAMAPASIPAAAVAPPQMAAPPAGPVPPGKAVARPASGPVGPASGRSGPRQELGPLRLAGRQIPLEQVLSAHVQSRARYPHSFSWWVLISLGGLVLLPWPFLFWPLEIGALVAWILLGSRKEHLLIVTLRDGMAHRHSFANKITALSHRNGIRGAIGQSLQSR
jgi:hypothetical protein